MNSKSNTDKETKTAATAVEEVMKAGDAKTDVKPAAEKAEAEPKAVKAVQEEVKPVEKKAEKEEPKTTKKPAAKKTGAKKADKPELKPEVFIEYQGMQAMQATVVDRVKAKFAASGHRVSSIKSLRIYIKPEEAKAYYVINEGKYTDSVDLF